MPLATTKPYQSVTTALPRADPARIGRASDAIYQDLFSAPGRIRTCDARFRKPMLYPLSYGSGTPRSTDVDCGTQSIRTCRPITENRRTAQQKPAHALRCPGYGARVKHANSGLRFLLELAMLASLGYYGFAQFDGVAAWGLGLGLPLVAAVVWGMFVSPKARHPTDDPMRILLEVALLGSGPVALAAAGSTGLAVIAG